MKKIYNYNNFALNLGDIFNYSNEGWFGHNPITESGYNTTTNCVFFTQYQKPLSSAFYNLNPLTQENYNLYDNTNIYIQLYSNITPFISRNYTDGDEIQINYIKYYVYFSNTNQVFTRNSISMIMNSAQFCFEPYFDLYWSSYPTNEMLLNSPLGRTSGVEVNLNDLNIAPYGTNGLLNMSLVVNASATIKSYDSSGNRIYKHINYSDFSNYDGYNYIQFLNTNPLSLMNSQEIQNKIDSAYNEGYNSVNQNEIYNNGFNAGKEIGYQNGYNQGITEEYNLGSDLLTLADIPMNIFKNTFNFDFLGINFGFISLGIITALIVLAIIKKII